MGLPAYSFTNLVTTTNALVAISSASGYPVANIKDGFNANPWKATSASFGNVGLIDLGWASGQTFDTFAILGHNFTAVTTPSLQEITAVSGSFVGTLGTWAYRAEDLWASITVTNKQFLRIAVTAASSTGNLQFGEVFMGTRVAMPRAARWGIVTGKEARGVTHRTYGGVTWDYEFYAMRFLRPTFRFPQSEYAAFELFSNTVGRDPFLWIPDVSGTEVYYVKKQRGFQPVPLGPFRDGSTMAVWYDWTLELEVETIGLVVNS